MIRFPFGDLRLSILDGGPLMLDGEAWDERSRASYPPSTFEPLTTLATKKRVFAQAIEEGWHIVFEHDPITPLAVLVEDTQGRIAARAIEVES